MRFVALIFALLVFVFSSATSAESTMRFDEHLRIPDVIESADSPQQKKHDFMEFLADLRPRSLQRDVHGRIHMVTFENASEIVRFHYPLGKHKRTPSYATIESRDGERVAISGASLSSLSSELERLPGDLTVIEPDELGEWYGDRIQDPFGSGYYDLGLAPQPPRCNREDCKDLCAAGAGVGTTGCALALGVPVAQVSVKL
jgi:hypothetical protein